MALQFADLINDVNRGRLSPADAKRINDRRLQLESAIDAEAYQVVDTQTASYKRVGSNLLNVKGYGHRTLGARTHGKHAVGSSGSGYGRYEALRLHRVA